MVATGGIEFLIRAIDLATEPFTKVAAGIERTTAKFTEMRQKSGLVPKSIDDLKQHLNNLQTERGTTISKQRISELNGQIEKVGKQISKLEHLPPPGFLNKLKGANEGLTKMGGLVAGAFSVGAIVSFGNSVVETTSKYQKLEAVLTTQLQSAGAGKQAMQMIQDFAASTPFQVDELTASFVKLTSQGFQPTKDQMTNLGDLAASMGKPFDQLAEAVLDAQTGEFERMKEFGIKAKQHGDQISMTFKGQTTVIDKSAASMQKYILGLGKAPGVIGSMAAISETTGGKLSNLGDAVDFLKKGLGEGLKPMIDKVVEVLQKFVAKLQPLGNWLKEHPQFVKWFAVTLGVAALGITIATTAMWLFNAALWANPLTWVVIGIMAVAAAVAYAVTYFDGWGASISALWSIIKSFASIYATVWKILWENITYNLEIGWLKIKNFFQWIGDKISNVFEGIQKLVKFDFAGAYASINKDIVTTASKEIEEKQKQHEGQMKKYTSDISNNVKNIGDQWDKIGITAVKEVKKETPVEKATREATEGNKPKGKNANPAADKTSSINSGGNKPTVINMTFHKLQDQTVIHTTNLEVGAKQAGKQIVDEILMALHSVTGNAIAS